MFSADFGMSLISLQTWPSTACVVLCIVCSGLYFDWLLDIHPAGIAKIIKVPSKVEN